MATPPFDYRRYLGHDLKAAYQRNMLASMLVVYGSLLCAMLVWMLVFQPPRAQLVTLPVTAGRALDNWQGRQNQQVSGEYLDETGRMFLAGLGRKLTIVPDRPAMQLPSAAPPDSSILVSGELHEYMPTIQANSSERFLGKLLGVPSNLPVINLPGANPFRNGIIYLPDPKFPAAARRDDTGVVEIGITIYASGSVSWAVLSESPRNRGFAEATVESLRRGIYYPPVLYWETQTITFKLISTICLACEPALESNVKNLRVRRAPAGL